MLVSASCPALTLLYWLFLSPSYSIFHHFFLFYFALISTCRGTFVTEPLILLLVLSSCPSAWEICLISFIPLYCRVRCPPGRTHSWPSGSTGHSSGERNMYSCCFLGHVLNVQLWRSVLVQFLCFSCVLIETFDCSSRQSSWSSMWRRTGAPSLRSSGILRLQIRSVDHI